MELQLNRRSKILLNGRENLPIDLVMEILSRLPLKSIGRCCCVSKLWASILGLPYFLDLFATRSSARPHMLFACRRDGKVLFFSAPQPQNFDVNSSSDVTANYLSRVSYDGSYCYISGPVHGLVCLTFKDNKESSKGHIICNPSTGQTLTLPQLESMVGVRSPYKAISLLWYDPTDKKGKVLFMEEDVDHSISLVVLKHKVMTLGTQKLEWRRTKCCIPHYSYVKGICINGVLYYRSVRAYTHDSVIVCFDARSEEFSFIEVETTFKVPLICGQYINYNGKFGLLLSQGWDYADEASSSFELVVIGDSENQEWSTRKYVLPPTWKNMVKEKLGFVGFIGTHTIVLTHPSSYIIYYNIEKNTIVKVSIQGLDGFKCFEVLTFVDYVEDLRA
ncbi:unnamed protein product [Brassica oleracea var. botrytis]|uniref:F-box domain-containing protein n=2 Tax=Brassica TaxID=3705 RepID=A0A3P6AYN1_BRAOL|nr:unnamed protein product [Brassica napus]CDY72470.1 BnaCnng77820D [Brassica napus]VDC89158.1 unnamed protein product [Brassica oleracea]